MMECIVWKYDLWKSIDDEVWQAIKMYFCGHKQPVSSPLD